MEPRVSYLICATPRCGGYLLFEALENTRLAGNPGEYFWEDERWAEEWVQQYRADKQKRENDNQTYSPFSITSWDFKTPNIP